MKTVFSSFDGIAHLWANQKQENARCSNGFFENNTIYSYGHHFEIGKIFNEIKVNNKPVILLTKEKYSATTSKHQSLVRWAIPKEQYTVIYVFSGVNDLYRRRYLLDGMFNQERAKRQIESLSTEFFNILSSQKTSKIVSYLPHLVESYDNLRLFCKAAKLRMPTKVTRAYDTFMANWPALQEKLNANRAKHAISVEKARQTRRENDNAKWERHKAIWAEQARINALSKIDRLKDFLKDETIQPETFNTDLTYLRIKNEKIETSRNANVSIKSAKLLYSMIKEGMNINGHNIDGYICVGINGTLKIGCHEIPMSEVNRIATQLNW